MFKLNMRRAGVALCVAGAVLFGAVAAKAETWTLHQHKYWKVAYMDRNSEGVPMCIAEVRHRNGVVFYIKTEGSMFWYELYDRNANWREHEGVLDFWVDRSDYVTMEAWAKGKSAQAYPESVDERSSRYLLDRIYQGRKLYIDWDGDDYSDYTIDLRGSAAAIGALVQCKNRL